MKYLLIGAVITVEFLLHASVSPVGAQEIKGNLKLGLDAGIFQYQSTTIKSRGTDQSSTVKGISFGVAMPSLLGVNFGYCINDNLVLGTYLEFDYGSQAFEGGGESSGISLRFLPHLLYVASRAASARPFLGPLIGVGTNKISTDVETTTTLFYIGAMLGVHWFAAESFSIDPKLMFFYAIGSGNSELASGDSSGLALTLFIGFTGWI